MSKMGVVLREFGSVSHFSLVLLSPSLFLCDMSQVVGTRSRKNKMVSPPATVPGALVHHASPSSPSSCASHVRTPLPDAVPPSPPSAAPLRPSARAQYAHTPTPHRSPSTPLADIVASTSCLSADSPPSASCLPSSARRTQHMQHMQHVRLPSFFPRFLSPTIPSPSPVPSRVPSPPCGSRRGRGFTGGGGSLMSFLEQNGSVSHGAISTGRQGSWISLVSRKDGERDAEAWETRRLLDAEELVNDHGEDLIRHNVRSR